jgi:hypothetical protein
MQFFLITRKNWRRRCSNASIVVKKTGDPLRLQLVLQPVLDAA